MARNKEFNPEEKLERARDLFWEKGYQATSMQDLVSQMKINRGSLYDTYGDKHQLFLESIDNYATKTFAEYKLIAQSEQDPLVAIEKIIRKAIDRSFEQEKLCLIVKSSFEMAPLDEKIKAKLVQLNNRLIIIIEELIAIGQDNGKISTAQNTSDLAYFVVGSLAGLWQMKALYNNKQMLLHMAKSIIKGIQ